MGWETDQPPINYLKRRIVYYKKKRGVYRNVRDDANYFREYGGKASFQKIIDRRIFWIEQRMKEFDDAVKKLEQK